MRSWCSRSLTRLISLWVSLFLSRLNILSHALFTNALTFSPLETENDENVGKVFLKHEYNRDGDSYRSPWSNQYFPNTESTFFPSAHLLQMEHKANAMFATYVKLYYD